MSKKARGTAQEAAAPSSVRNRSVKNGLIRAALIISPFFFWMIICLFWLSVDPGNKPFTVCSVFLGLLSSFVFSRVRIIRARPPAMAAGAVFSGAVCFLVSTQLYAKSLIALQAEGTFADLVGRMDLAAPGPLLRSSCLLLAALSFPFIFYVSSLVFQYILMLCGKDSLANLAGTFRTVSLRSTIKTHLVFIANIAAAVAAGILLLCAAYSIPTGPIDRNVARSAPVLEEEGVYPDIVSWCFSQADNETDSIMLLEAADDSDAPLLDRVLLNYRGTISSNIPFNSLIQHYCRGAGYDGRTSYERYWHGYLIFIKPLLYIADLRTMRLINGIAQLLLAVMLCAVMAKKNRRDLILPFIITYLMLKPVLLSRCFQYSTCYYISVIGSIALVSSREITKGRRALLLFLYIGIAVGYFDFLTYPAATFGIPAVIYLFMLSDRSVSEKMLRLFKTGYSWLFGYAAMWSSKWIVGSLLTGRNVIADGIGSVLTRTSSSTDETVSAASGGAGGWFKTVIGCWIKNIIYFLTNPFIVLLAAFLIIVIIKIRRTGRLSYRELCRSTAPYAFLAAVPIMWYTFALNHSQIHFFYTSKALSITVMAAAAGAAGLLRRCKADIAAS